MAAAILIGCSKPDDDTFTCECPNGTETRLSIFSRGTEMVTNGEWMDDGGGCEPGRADVYKANVIEIFETRCK